MPEAREATYQGGAALAGAVVQQLEAQGLTVEWKRPEERRDLSGMAEMLIVGLLLKGSTWQAIRDAVRVVRQRFPGVKLELENDDNADE